jgi:hypothetical protein
MNKKFTYLLIVFVSVLFITCSFSSATNVVENKDKIQINDSVKIIKNQGRGEIFIDVAKHVLPGTGLTLEEWEELIMEWIEHANDVYEGMLEFRQVGEIDLVDNTSSNRTAGAINIYGTNLTRDPPGNPGSCFDQTHIILGQAAANDTLAHELGHWFNGIPDGTGTEHGNPAGQYPGFPGITGRDTDGDGDCDEDDARNIMFPGTGRTNVQTDNRQERRIRENASDWARQVRATIEENAFASVDNIGDTEINFIDITDSHIWIDLVDDEYVMHFTLLLELFVMELGFEMGIYFNSDGNFETGDLETGIDYYLGWDGYNSNIVFKRCDEGTWITGETIPIEMIIEENWEDGPYDPQQIGLSFNLPLSSLIRHGVEGDDFYYYAKTTTSDYEDFSPNYGFFDITYPFPNQVPSKPIIQGPNNGKPNTEYTFTVNSNDPDGDYVYYYVEWGDGTNADWIGPYTSGTGIDVSHIWTSEDEFTIRVKAKDMDNAESDWATHPFSTPRNRNIHSFFEQFFQQFPNMFPILRYLLGLYD